MHVWWFTATLMAIAPAVAQSAPVAETEGLNLRLACPGSIDHTSTKSGFFGPTKDHQPVADQTDVDIANGSGRVRLPAKLMPMFGKPSDGWSSIKDLQIRGDAIDGTIALRSTSHPKLHIDRQSGTIAIDGILGKFFGQCKAIEPNQRAF